MKQPIVCCLGRYGDILNALPIAYELSRTVGRPKFVVSKQFWTILKGVSYVDPVVWDIDYKELPRAIARLPKEAIICQSYKHPDQRRLTESYQKEAWRVAGWLDKFGTLPLIFDKRNVEREYRVSERYVLFAGTSVSSPMDTDAIWMRLSDQFSMAHPMKQETPYDLLGQIESSQCIVTVDTMHLHLARATHTPIVALINNGWYGSVPQGNVKAAIRYADATPEAVAEAVSNAIK